METMAVLTMVTDSKEGDQMYAETRFSWRGKLISSKWRDGQEQEVMSCGKCGALIAEEDMERHAIYHRLMSGFALGDNENYIDRLQRMNGRLVIDYPAGSTDGMLSKVTDLLEQIPPLMARARKEWEQQLLGTSTKEH